MSRDPLFPTPEEACVCRWMRAVEIHHGGQVCGCAGLKAAAATDWRTGGGINGVDGRASMW
jgi:hypothetical protein